MPENQSQSNDHNSPNCDEAFCSLDSNYLISYITDEAAFLLQSTPEKLRNRKISVAVEEARNPEFFRAIAAVNPGNPCQSTEVVLDHATLIHRALISQGPEGEIHIFFVPRFEHDPSLQHLDLALEAAQIGLWEFDQVSNVFWIDRRIAQIHGWDESLREVPEEKGLGRVHRGDIERIEQTLQQAWQGDRHYEEEYRIVLDDGEIRWISGRAKSAWNKLRGRYTLVGTAIDITGQKRVQEAIADHMPGIVAICDDQFRYRYVNRTYEEYVGVSADEVLGRQPREILGEANWSIIAPHLKAALRGEPQHWRATLQFPGVGERFFRAFYVPLLNSQGEITSVLVQTIDTTRERQLQQEVLNTAEQEKARIGGDIHDTICQELRGLGHLCETLEHKLRKENSQAVDDLLRICDGISAATDKAARLARGLMILEAGSRSLQQILSDILNNLTTVHPDVHFELKKTGHRELPTHQTVVTQLSMIAREAILNALRHARPSRIQVHLELRKDYTVLTVTDDGGGKVEKLLAARETGLGLRSMAYRSGLLDGKFDIEPSPDQKGISIRCTIRQPWDHGGIQGWEDELEED